MRFVVLLTVLLGAPAGPVAHLAHAQAPSDSARAWSEDAWTAIATRQGVEFAYIFYQKADNANNGVVIRLRNRNDHPVRYAFTVVFRTPNAERTARASGRLQAGEMQTGEPDGLFWIPFKDGRSIGEIGLRRIRISPLGYGRGGQGREGP